METARSIIHFELPLKSVHIQCLDENKNPISDTTGSGFICLEDGKNFLYTCWHLVSGIDMHNLNAGIKVPKRAFIRVTLQKASYKNISSNPEKVFEAESIGGYQELDIPLYHPDTTPPLPAWYQDRSAAPDSYSNNWIRLPKWHDAVKILFPPDIRLSVVQTISTEQRNLATPSPGDQLLIAGYPYGYSPEGLHRPSAIVLTRNVAAAKIQGRKMEGLLDGFGAPGMSGGPVFTKTELGIQLVGIYTGLLYPDYLKDKRDRATALGTFCPLTLCWRHMPLVPYDQGEEDN